MSLGIEKFFARNAEEFTKLGRPPDMAGVGIGVEHGIHFVQDLAVGSGTNRGRLSRQGRYHASRGKPTS